MGLAMKPFTIGSSLVFGLFAPLSALAEEGRWTLAAEDGTCEIAFINEQVDDGILAIDRFGTCGASIDQITGYALNNEGAVILFYSTFTGVDLIGQVMQDETGAFKGSFRKGGALLLEHRSGSRAISDPVTGAALLEADEGFSTEAEAEADAPIAEAVSRGPCLALSGQPDSCADDADLGPPDTGEMLVVTRLNLRNIPGTDGSSVIGRVEAGTCVAVNICLEDTQGRLWCGISTASGEGFVLKQDDKTVYARNTCP
jgi:hypothetical protein